MAAPTIAIVCDQPGLVTLLDLALQDLDYATLPIPNAMDAYITLADHPVALILVALSGRTLTTRTLCHVLHLDPAIAPIPVIVATEHPETVEDLRLPVITTPFNLEALAQAVEAALARPDP